MSRNQGQIPPYGTNFRLEDLPYHPELASRAYVLKRDARWFIRSDKTSKVWTIFYVYGPSPATVIPMGKTLPTLGIAMMKLLEGVDRGLYQCNGA